MSGARLLTIEPAWVLPGARVTLHGTGLRPAGVEMPRVSIDGEPARVVMASSTRIGLLVPDRLAPGRHSVTVDGCSDSVEVQAGGVIASEIHQVDNPAIGPDGSVFLTMSGTRGQEVPISVFRVPPGAEREPYLSGLVNATSLAFDALGVLHVSSRFDGAVYRVTPERTLETVASDLGVAFGIAFGSDGTMYVGDRSGTVFRAGVTGRVVPYVSLPPSMAAYHLAIGPEDALYVTAPTFGTYDRVYRIVRGHATAMSSEFGRPQGLAVSDDGDLYVVDAAAGCAGLYRVRDGQKRVMVLAAPALVGVALDPRGGLVVSSNDTAYRLDVPLKPHTV
ncbi:MAG: IPT/TIG domain-containing protein [Acidobacteriota bacterium]